MSGKINPKDTVSVFFLIICSKVVSKTLDFSNLINFVYMLLDKKKSFFEEKFLILKKEICLFLYNSKFKKQKSFSLTNKNYDDFILNGLFYNTKIGHSLKNNAVITKIINKKKSKKNLVIGHRKNISGKLKKIENKIRNITVNKKFDIDLFFYYNKIFRYKFRNSNGQIFPVISIKKNIGLSRVNADIDRDLIIKEHVLSYDDINKLNSKMLLRIRLLLKNFLLVEKKKKVQFYEFKNLYKERYFQNILKKSSYLKKSQIKQLFQKNKKIRNPRICINLDILLEKTRLNFCQDSSNGNFITGNLSNLDYSEKKEEILVSLFYNKNKTKLLSQSNFRFSRKENYNFYENSINSKFSESDENIETKKLSSFVDQIVNIWGKKMFIYDHYKILIMEKIFLEIFYKKKDNLLKKIIIILGKFLEKKYERRQFLTIYNSLNNCYRRIILEKGKQLIKKMSLLKIISFQEKIINNLTQKEDENIFINLNIKKKTGSSVRMSKKIFILEKHLKKLKSLTACREDEFRNKLVKGLLQKINCPVNNNLEKDVLLEDCGHTFSSRCIQNLIKKRNRKCPICGSSFGLVNVKSLYLI